MPKRSVPCHTHPLCFPAVPQTKKMGSTQLDFLFTINCCGYCIELKASASTENRGLFFHWFLLMGQCDFQAVELTHFTMWNKSACNDSPRMLWCLHNPACFLALLQERSIAGLSIFQHIHFPVLKTPVLSLMEGTSLLEEDYGHMKRNR